MKKKTFFFTTIVASSLAIFLLISVFLTDPKEAQAQCYDFFLVSCGAGTGTACPLSSLISCGVGGTLLSDVLSNQKAGYIRMGICMQ
jgi:hypothetical protein